MHVDPMMPLLVSVVLAILLVAVGLKRLGQPTVVGYLVAGIILGPYGIAVLNDAGTMSRMGGFGIVLLMFFVGMEMCLDCLVVRWRIALIGTLVQIMASVACVWLIGRWFHWPLARIVLLGFVISLSSTAVVIKILQDSGELDTHVAQNVVGILLTQDMAIICMLIVLNLLKGPSPQPSQIMIQLAGAAGVATLFAYIARKRNLTLPLAALIGENLEMQVFAALIICFGMALLMGIMGLSTAMGAFVGGIVVTASSETRWVHESLYPFRVVFIALFFVSVGMQLDLKFLTENWVQIGLLVLTVLFTNTVINAVILRFLGESWRDSFYAGALLSQIGEFSFVLAAVGYRSDIISAYGYQMAIATIVLSLLLTVFWINPVKRWHRSYSRASERCDER